ncbi:histidine phosphatase family protein [Paenibacillus aceris]|uniref:Phosphoglycerate mutase n=1 Tax=Paenibacillus aceris TaxID=869555 RepID=A0ABS4I5J5_9BACL|nr:histidine phosphatase family protein [Paenibacillus aceris]MBP1966187.1 putative phosphoglycerate mutase [Paenibacillus aceris]NHW33342.1 histidine phosphatase family protein [Paenibacillus aceris]
MRILIIRHADPDYPNDTITAAGHLEAQALAQRLKKEGIDRIYSSPVNRALHTMQYTAELLGMESTIEPWTRELDLNPVNVAGSNVAAWNIPGETVRSIQPYPGHEIWPERAPYHDYAKDYEKLKADSDEFLRRHGYEREEGRYRMASSNRETIAVFCHHGFGVTWLAHLLELPLPLVWSGFWLPPSSVTTILFEERSQDWAVPRCTGLGSIAHLHEAGLKISTAGLLANDV